MDLSKINTMVNSISFILESVSEFADDEYTVNSTSYKIGFERMGVGFPFLDVHGDQAFPS